MSRYIKAPPEVRFKNRLSQYTDINSCWIWDGAKSTDGYGIFSENASRENYKRVLAHRFCWALLRGPIPEGIHVLHRCDTPACINPNHLFLGTNLENIKDKISKGRQIRGEKMGGAKLTDDLVRLIKSSPEKSSYKWSKELGVCIQTICNVRLGVTWAHIT